jgi:drug/metabolite transporter (DMT)-like permease
MRLKADLLLLFVTLLWGTAFVAMRVAAGHGTVFFLNGSRFFLGGLLLLPFTKFKGVFNRKNIPLVGLAGLSLYTAAAFQQAGLASTTAGNGGFITSLYVVIVPLILWVVWRERPSLVMGIAVCMAITGGFLLSTAGTFRVNPGDLLIFVGSFFWALHVVVVGKSQGHIDALPFALGQYLVCGVFNLVTGAFFERPSRADLLFVMPAVLYTAVFSIAIGFTLQVIGQKHTPATDAALILSLESVFAAFFGWLILRESLHPVQVVGCGIILLAVILVQINNGKIPQL